MARNYIRINRTSLNFWLTVNYALVGIRALSIYISFKRLVAVDNAGLVYTWGHNEIGELGDSNPDANNDTSIPAVISGTFPPTIGTWFGDFHHERVISAVISAKLDGMGCYVF